MKNRKREMCTSILRDEAGRPPHLLSFVHQVDRKKKRGTRVMI